MRQKKVRATKAIIHLENFSHNLDEIKKCLSAETKMCVAVKADAYGHGAVKCAQVAEKQGAAFLAVATVEEGAELRAAGIKTPILMLSLCAPEEIPEAVANDITPFVFDEEYALLFDAEVLRQNKKDYCVHIAVDTGMGRIGVYENEAASLAGKISLCKGIKLGGMATHLAVSDSVTASSVEYTKNQFEKFKRAIESVKKEGIDPGICHCANSAATLAFPEFHLDMVRPGIITYGYYADEVDREYLKSRNIDVDLKPVMTVETSVCAVRDVFKGESVGYGRTWCAEENTKVGVLTAGYADGILRNYSSSGVKISVNGKLYPICGRICMDQFIINLGKDGENGTVKRWDKAVIFGAEEDGALLTADDIARLTGTISYEVTCCISKRVRRIFINS